MNPNLVDIGRVPLYLDGSGGSMWPLRSTICWPEIMLDTGDLADRRFIKVSDLITVLKENGISLIYGTKQPQNAS